LREDSGEIHGWVGLNIDATESKEAEKALRQSEERLDWRFTLKRGPHRIGDLRRKGTHFSKLG